MMFGVLEAKSNGARGCPRHILIPHLIIIRHLPHLLIFTPHLEQNLYTMELTLPPLF